MIILHGWSDCRKILISVNYSNGIRLGLPLEFSVIEQ